MDLFSFSWWAVLMNFLYAGKSQSKVARIRCHQVICKSNISVFPSFRSSVWTLHNKVTLKVLIVEQTRLARISKSLCKDDSYICLQLWIIKKAISGSFLAVSSKAKIPSVASPPLTFEKANFLIKFL